MLCGAGPCPAADAPSASSEANISKALSRAGLRVNGKPRALTSAGAKPYVGAARITKLQSGRLLTFDNCHALAANHDVSQRQLLNLGRQNRIEAFLESILREAQP